MINMEHDTQHSALRRISSRRKVCVDDLRHRFKRKPPSAISTFLLNRYIERPESLSYREIELVRNKIENEPASKEKYRKFLAANRDTELDA